MAVVSSGIALGFFYRASTLIFATWRYLFLLDRAYFQNHWYLICLLSFMMFLIPANRVWSLDTSKEQKDSSVPRWSLLILKIQLSLVYFYGAVAKLNSDWFRRVPVDGWLASRVNDPIIGQTMRTTMVQHSSYIWRHRRRSITCMPSLLASNLLDRVLQWLWLSMCLTLKCSKSVYSPAMIAALGLFAPPDGRESCWRDSELLMINQCSYATAAREARIGNHR